MSVMVASARRIVRGLVASDLEARPRAVVEAAFVVLTRACEATFDLENALVTVVEEETPMLRRVVLSLEAAEEVNERSIVQEWGWGMLTKERSICGKHIRLFCRSIFFEFRLKESDPGKKR